MDIPELLLTRFETGDEGTFGELVFLDDRCVTVELPWRENAKDRSCIPAGTYEFFWREDSPKHGACYEAKADDDAPGRTHIQLHKANLAGDVEKGYVSELLGCIAPGLAIMKFQRGIPPAGDKEQYGVTSSKAALEALVAKLEKKPFRLKIIWADGVI